jgi:acetyl esterase/lipase
LAVGDTRAEAADVGDPMNTREGLAYFAAEYLQGHAPTDPAANVLHADLRGLPPLLLLAATRDIGYSDSLQLAELARISDVPVTVHTYHGLIHNWQLAAHVPEAAEAIDVASRFVDEHLSGDGGRG